MMELGLVTTNAPANDNEERPVLSPEAPGEEIAVPTVAFRKMLPEAPARAPVLVVFPAA